MRIDIRGATDPGRLKQQVRASDIVNHLTDIRNGMRRIAHAQNKQRQFGDPKMYDAETLQPIDIGAQVARAEEIRAEKKHQEQIAAWQREAEERKRLRQIGAIE